MNSIDVGLIYGIPYNTLYIVHSEKLFWLSKQMVQVFFFYVISQSAFRMSQQIY